MKRTVPTKTCKLVSMSIPISLQMRFKKVSATANEIANQGDEKQEQNIYCRRAKLHNDNFSVKSQHLALMTNGKNSGE